MESERGETVGESELRVTIEMKCTEAECTDRGYTTWHASADGVGVATIRHYHREIARERLSRGKWFLVTLDYERIEYVESQDFGAALTVARQLLAEVSSLTDGAT